MKLEQQEIEQLNNIMSLIDSAVISLGEISYQRLSLDEEEKAISNRLKEINEDKNKLTEELYKKYGKININSRTGEYTTAENNQ